MISNSSPKHGAISTCFVLIAVFVIAAPAQAQSTVTFSKVFVPPTVGPGSTATLQFTITNTDVTGATDLAFTDNLPAGVSIADPSNALNFCGGTLTALAGGTAITLSGGSIGPITACGISVNVTSSTPGTHVNMSGDLTSSAGNSGTASANLVVSTGLPGFSKSFAPSSVSFGGRSTLTFTVDNTANVSNVSNLDFLDTLPVGMVIADPANAATTCGTATVPPILTATAGTSFIILDANGTFAFPAVAAGATCTVAVDVVAQGAGFLGNTSGDLLADFVPVGRASATLESTVTSIALQKSFTDDPVPPGGTVTLDFTINNFDRFDPATGIAFTDDLAAGLAGLTFSSLLSNDCGGTVSGVGTTTIGFSGGSLPSEGSCTISTSLTVPAGATPEIYTNTTGLISATVGGSPVTGNMASDILWVAPAPVFTKEFTDDPVGAGEDVNLQFTITNTSLTSGITDIEFTDELTAFLPFPVSATLPAIPCGASSSMALISLGFERQGLELTGGSLAASGSPGDSCTFDVTVTIPIGFPSGNYVNTTSTITGTVGGGTVIGPPASDILEVVGGPRLLKEFTDDPAQPGGTVTLEFTLTHDSNAPADATGIGFTDDVNAALTGLVAVGLPANDVCGAGSQISGTSSLSFTGGALAPGASCIFSVTLQVPAGATSGPYTNTTSNVTATVGGVSVTEFPATDDLMIAGLDFTKEFTDDPALPGGIVTLEFTIANVSPVEDATSIQFTDDLSGVITGLTATGLPVNDVCGSGSSLSGTNVLVLSGGNLLAGASCTFSVTLNVPLGVASDSYPNLTSSLSALMNGTPVAFPGAADQLVVSSDRLGITKSFTDDPVAPGGTATLEFTVTNLDPVNSASTITFTDDLDAALSGLAATGLPMADVCGAGSQIDGTTSLSLTGGNLTPGSSCTFSVTVQVPGAAPAGVHTNVTSQVTGNVSGFPVTGAPAADDLLVVSGQSLSITKSFTDDPVLPGDTANLEFTITNLDGASNATAISFTDDLDAALSGLAAAGLPMNDVCGLGSQISGAGLLSLSGGGLPAGGSCTFAVPVQVPANAPAGAHTNVTSQVIGDIGGLPVAGNPATDDLLVNRLTFSKAFGGPVPAGETTTLTFTIENFNLTSGVTDISFTDDLDAVVPGMAAVGLPAADVCGAGSTLSGTSLLTLTGGNLPPGGSCTFGVDVQIPISTAPGTYPNTTSDLFELGLPASEPAVADIVVEAAPAGANIPVTTPIGTIVLIALIAAAALWRLRWSG